MKGGVARAAVAAALLVAFALAGHLVLTGSAPPAAPKVSTVAPALIPTLYCEFYNFMRNGTVVSFLFAADQSPRREPRFFEMAVVEPDATRTEYEVGQRPRWAWGRDDDGVLTITSPDGATRILLYGFQPTKPGTFWTEAGVRSDTYKNLEGKCRQANFGDTRRHAS